MGDGTGANPIEAMQGGELAETLANAMAGIADMYDQLLDDARARIENSDVSNGFNVFKNSTYQSFVDVQAHGLALANNIQDGAGSVAQEDWEISRDSTSTTDNFIHTEHEEQWGALRSSSGRTPLRTTPRPRTL